ncbi:hypothetical protein [Hymenobacter sp. 5516J-16]|uniref:hypothetical protein n=1 Tax=Hymenobacter sp. 5516J-16 TaxID=2932253 RepID=UPI00293E7C9A|nr:hypothetical protein [Hymenobacter sp. 5516J-16]
MQYLEGRKYVVQAIFLAVALVFATRLFYIQVLDGSYKLAADRNTLQRIVQTPYRASSTTERARFWCRIRPCTT